MHTMKDNIPQNELTPRDTTVFRIVDKFSEIINNLNQQLHEEKVQKRSLAAVCLDLKLEIEKSFWKIDNWHRNYIGVKISWKLRKFSKNLALIFQWRAMSKQELPQYRHPLFQDYSSGRKGCTIH